MMDSVRATRRSTRRDAATQKNGNGDGFDSSEEEAKDKISEMRDVSPARSLRRSTSLPNIVAVPGAKRPKDTAFRQQRLPAWQPILTPYNVIPTLFILAVIFIPLGIVFLVFSNKVVEYTFDYSSCLSSAPLNQWGSAPSSYGSVPFRWRRLNRFPSYAEQSSSDFVPDYVDAESLCELEFDISQSITGPVFQYYKLSNFYQNQRLYVKSVDWQQLKGAAKPAEGLGDCAPLVGPGTTNEQGTELVYYPCGLIANSMFNDTIGALLHIEKDKPVGQYYFPPTDIAWPFEKDRYGPSNYAIKDVRPPPFWAQNRRLVDANGLYRSLPNFSLDERFQNWMKVSGLPNFRKTYGKCLEAISPGTYRVLISSTYEVQSYGAHKSLVISNTSWIGGKNPFLGWAYIGTGSVFLLLGTLFLLIHFCKPRQLGDVRYLTWERGSTESVNMAATRESENLQ